MSWYQKGITNLDFTKASKRWVAVCMDDDADAKVILTPPPTDNWRDHQSILVSGGWTSFSTIWEPTISHWTKQSIWPRTVLCGGWCLCMVLHSPSGACQKRRSGISWAICKSAPHSRQITLAAPYHTLFYRPDALPATQPTASKHWRQSITICTRV